MHFACPNALWNPDRHRDGSCIGVLLQHKRDQADDVVIQSEDVSQTSIHLDSPCLLAEVVWRVETMMPMTSPPAASLLPLSGMRSFWPEMTPMNTGLSSKSSHASPGQSSIDLDTYPLTLCREWLECCRHMVTVMHWLPGRALQYTSSQWLQQCSFGECERCVACTQHLFRNSCFSKACNTITLRTSHVQGKHKQCTIDEFWLCCIQGTCVQTYTCNRLCTAQAMLTVAL